MHHIPRLLLLHGAYHAVQLSDPRLVDDRGGCPREFYVVVQQHRALVSRQNDPLLGALAQGMEQEYKDDALALSCCDHAVHSEDTPVDPL